MAIVWSDLREFVRVAILKDSPEGQFTDAQLLIDARWACQQLSMHTAEKATRTYTSDGAAYRFDLPDNIVDGIEKASLVIYNSTNRQEILPPMRMIPSESWELGVPKALDTSLHSYYEWPNDVLMLTFIPEKDSTIEVRYFKTWDAPETSDSELKFPRQFELPFAFLLGAIALDPLGAQAATIRQWNRKSDSGTPLDNALSEQADYFRRKAQDALDDIGPQDRETFYKIGHRDFGYTR